MKLLTQYFKVIHQLYDYFDYQSSGKILPLEDFTDFYWALDLQRGRLYYQEEYPLPELPTESVPRERALQGLKEHAGATFDFTDDFVEVYPGEEYTLVQIITEDEEEWLYIFPNVKQISFDA